MSSALWAIPVATISATAPRTMPISPCTLNPSGSGSSKCTRGGGTREPRPAQGLGDRPWAAPSRETETVPPQESHMSARRRRQVVMVVVTCLLSVPLTVWVVSRSHAGRIHRTAAGEDGHTGVTPPLVLAERPPPPPPASPGAHAGAGPAHPEEASASPRVVHVARAAPPVSLAAAVHPASPPVEPSRTPEASPRRESIAAALAAQARRDLHRLDGLEAGAGSPMGRVAHLFTFLEHQPCAGGACQAAQR